MKNFYLIIFGTLLFVTGCSVNHLGEGLSAGRSRNYTEMLRHCTEASRLVNPDPLALKCLGDAHMNLGHTQAAEEAYLSYLVQVPNDIESRFILVNLYVNTGRYTAAQTQLETILSMQPGNIDALYLLGETHRMLGNCDAALLNYDNALKINPNYSNAALAKTKAESEICSKKRKKKIVKIIPKTIKKKKFEAGGAAIKESDW